MMSVEKPQVQATRNILHPADEPQASFAVILQSITKGSTDGTHAAFLAWDSS